MCECDVCEYYCGSMSFRSRSSIVVVVWLSSAMSTAFCFGAMYWANFSMIEIRSCGGSAAMSRWKFPESMYCCQWSEIICRNTAGFLFGVPLARPPSRPRPSFFCRAILLLVFCS